MPAATAAVAVVETAAVASTAAESEVGDDDVTVAGAGAEDESAMR